MDNAMSTPEKMKPCLHIEDSDLPMLKTASLGEVVNLTVKGKITGLNQGQGSEATSATIEIQSVNDGDFKKKGYKDVIEETEGIEEAGTDEQE